MNVVAVRQKTILFTLAATLVALGVAAPAASADSVAPDAKVIVPLSGELLADGPVVMRGTATDDTGVAAVRVSVRNRVTGLWWHADGTWGTFASQLATLSTPGQRSTAWSYPWPGAGAGAFTLLVKAQDTAGNVDPTQPAVPFSVQADGPFAPPRHLRTIGRPGHAGVYAWGMATGADGTIVVSDYNNYVVRRYTTGGTQVQTFSSRGDGPGQTNEPYGVAVDPTDGTVYVADPLNHEIDRWSADGTYVASLRVSSRLVGIVYNPRLAVGSDGWLYVVNSHDIIDGWPHRIVVYDKEWNAQQIIGDVGTGDGQFGVIRGIATGPDDDLYVVDAGNRRVQVLDRFGNFKRSIGGPGTGPGQFGLDIRGISVDRDNGWVYVVDTGQSQIEKFTLDGGWIQSWNPRGPDTELLNGGAREITVGHDHNVYVADFTNTRVNVFTPSGGFLRSIPDPVQAAPDGGFNQPEDVAVNPSTGAVYVADTYNHRIQQFSRNGAFVAKWGFRGVRGGNAMNYPRGIAVDRANGNVWLDNTRSGNIKGYTPQRRFIRSFGSWGYDTPEENWYARGIWASASGRLYIPDSGVRDIEVTDQVGTILTSWPCGSGRSAGGGTLLGCTGVTEDAAGNIYAAAVTEHVVYKWDPNGTPIAKFGTPGTGDGELGGPYDVAASGNRLYVSEMNNDRISVFDLDGVFLGSWGSTGKEHGQFDQPMGLSVDVAGNVYVADTWNERIEVFAR